MAPTKRAAAAVAFVILGILILFHLHAQARRPINTATIDPTFDVFSLLVFDFLCVVCFHSCSLRVIVARIGSTESGKPRTSVVFLVSVLQRVHRMRRAPRAALPGAPRGPAQKGRRSASGEPLSFLAPPAGRPQRGGLRARRSTSVVSARERPAWAVPSPSFPSQEKPRLRAAWLTLGAAQTQAQTRTSALALTLA